MIGHNACPANGAGSGDGRRRGTGSSQGGPGVCEGRMIAGRVNRLSEVPR